MLLSRVELLAHELSPLWNALQDSRDELGQLIITDEVERAINKLDHEVKVKKLFLSQEQEKRIAKARGLGRKIGGQRKELSIEQIKKMMIEGKSWSKIAKSMGVNRQTIANRLKEEKRE